MGSWFLRNSYFFADFDQNTKVVPTKISKKKIFFDPSKCQNNKENLVYYRSKLFLWKFEKKAIKNGSYW
jgi:hypothetical protein